LAKNTPVIIRPADKSFVKVRVSSNKIMAAIVAKNGCEYINEPATLAPSL
jgi:hypothetical protein